MKANINFPVFENRRVKNAMKSVKLYSLLGIYILDVFSLKRSFAK